MIYFPTNISFLAIIIAAVVAYILGALWYSPFAFGPIWSRERNFTPEEAARVPKELPLNSALTILGYLLTGYVFAVLFGYIRPESMHDALYISFLAWLGVAVPVSLMTKIYGRNTWNMFFIDIAYELVYLSAIAAILYYWR